MSSNLAELTGIDVPTRLLIGGEWTGGRGGGTLPVQQEVEPPAFHEFGHKNSDLAAGIVSFELEDVLVNGRNNEAIG